MVGFIPDSKIDEVRDAANIVEVVGTYVNLRQTGRIFKGLCPFHAEKTPSFTVNPEKRIFHCFGCGVGGNVFRFLMLQRNLSFPEAVAELAERHGIDLPRQEGGRSGREDKRGLHEVVDMAREFFEEELEAPSGRPARDYLARRGLGPEICRKFHLGWAPPGWDNLVRRLASRKVPIEIMEKAGLARSKTSGRGCYDIFRARIICPIFDLDGRTVAFGGRIIQDEKDQPKYLNSPETPIYSKGRLLYGLNFARVAIKEKDLALIVEGYFDLLSLFRARGIYNVTATLGTALTTNHLRIIKGYAREAIMVYDADEAGRNAAARGLPLFMAAGLEGKVLSLPDGHDPDTYVRAFGPERFEESLASAAGLLDFYLDRTLERHPGTLAGKAQAVQEVIDLISSVEGPANQEILRQALAKRMGLSEESLRLSERRRLTENHDDVDATPGLAGDFERELLRLVLLHPETESTLLSAGLADQFSDPSARKIYEAMVDYFEIHGQVDADRLLENLDNDEAGLLTELALGEDGMEGDYLELAVRDFLKKFQIRKQKIESADILVRIREAHAKGDDEACNKILREKNRRIKQK